jgi:mRNA interferase MazF
VLVLSREAVLDTLRRPLVAPLTTRIRELPTEVGLDLDDGLPRPCVVSLDNVQPLPVALMLDRIARLAPERMAEVCAALAAAVDCD